MKKYLLSVLLLLFFLSGVNAFSIDDRAPNKNNPVATTPKVFVGGSGLGSHASSLTPYEVQLVLHVTRRYDTQARKWESFSWSKEQRENILSSWVASNERLNAKRIIG